ncbi:hypothetical protein ACFWPQ_28045 [Streptomyces sp. NPDC058464]|uniref:hypothetical protein n=1 Tax=Streptomyces sp. NPDC058464 TaxID=3346511 RepID=UPI00364CA89C
MAVYVAHHSRGQTHTATNADDLARLRERASDDVDRRYDASGSEVMPLPGQHQSGLGNEPVD